ncbi:anti-sigma factor family protein [Pseudonocardia oroxyli]|uniref:Putative zinc-finger n=1 Tax=Pseudonocardia oroxyli TaxID=366584 RepID=A0A1G7G8K8_PSEOR|nr:zf-HC2 domain-containing protein [Pseudonocardia oroxyli]SDE84460.1 Putative zinc-finger [Pseudonocardia oroxyli]
MNDSHRTIREQLGAYLLGGLTAPEETALGAHLDGCPDCRAELDDLRPVADALAGVAPQDLAHAPAPPPFLIERVLDEVRRTPRPAAAPPRRRAPLLVAAAVVVAALVGGGVGFIAGTGPDAPREAVAVRTLAGGVQASATVIPHTWGIEITLDADGFTAGTPYRVVVIDDAGRTVGAGEFLGTGADPMVCNLNTSVLRAQAAGFDVLDPDGRVVVHGEL